MELRDGLDFVRSHHHAVLLTRRRDGSPQLSPVTVALDEQRGQLLVSTRETAAKVHNVRRDPSVTLCVLSDEFFGPWVTLAGSASVSSLPDALEPLVDYYRAVAGEHPDWADYRAAMVRERRCLLRVEVSGAGPDRHG